MLFFCAYVVGLFIFFLMIRRPPISTRTVTLFPYTTLFRSLYLVASLTICAGAADIENNPGLVPAVDVGVDAGEPGFDVTHQQILLTFAHEVGPGRFRLRPRIDIGETSCGHEIQDRYDPVDAIFEGGREVADRGERPARHEQVRKAGAVNPEKGLRPVFPFLLQLSSFEAADVDTVIASGDCIEACRIDDEVDFKLLLARHNRGFRYPDERRLAKVYKSDIGLVVDLVIIRLERHAASPEPKALRGQPFRDLGILHPLPNLPPHNLRDDFVGLRVGGDVMEVRLPDADTLVPIERFKERLALGLGKVEHAARVRIVHEPAVRRPAADDDLLIAGL